MTEPDDRVDAVVAAFLDHLEGLGVAPALDGLDADERARAEALISSLEAGRGIDPSASRPSLEQLLAGTPLATALHAGRAEGRGSAGAGERQRAGGRGSAGAGDDLLGRIREQLTRYAPFHVDIWPDDAAAAVGIDSDVVALVSAQRLRIQIRDDVDGPSALAALDPAAVAGPVFGAFPDTAGVIVVHPDDELSSVAIDPFDTEHCIETPAGTVTPPATHRPVMPLVDTVRAYLDEIAPALDTTSGLEGLPAAEVDAAGIARDAAIRAVERVVLEGRRAKIDAKQATWSALGEPETDAIVDLVLDAIAGLEPATLESRIRALADAA
ncbi:MAG TPA: hypothetical protein VK891_13380 [Euzebyales bacterium]|nr:hypothetical protein [Euzebyales bacterium]